MTQRSDDTDNSSKGQSVYRLKFLGLQNLTRAVSTGFGAVQKPLKEIYFGHLLSAAEFDRSQERTVMLGPKGLTIRFWDSRSRQFQQQLYPFDHVSYVELVFFQTVKGKKRFFGYFRRYTDTNDVVPDSVLIPLHKKDHKMMKKLKHLPLLVLILRRPSGIQFLDCHVFAVDVDTVGVSFVEEFDLLSHAFYNEKTSNLFNYNPYNNDSNESKKKSNGELHKWSSQPMLQRSQMSVASDLSDPVLTPVSTSSHKSSPTHRLHRSNVNLLASVPSPIHQQNEDKKTDKVVFEPKPDGSFLLEAQPIKRSVSTTICDKYKELEAFNISEYEYFSFQEMQALRAQQSERKPSLEESGAVSVQVPRRNPQNPLPLPPRASRSGSKSNIPVPTQIKARSSSDLSDKRAQQQQPAVSSRQIKPKVIPEQRPSVILEERNSIRGENVNCIVNQFEVSKENSNVNFYKAKPPAGPSLNDQNESRNKPVATVHPRLLPGSVAVLPLSISNEDLLKMASKNPRSPTHSSNIPVNPHQVNRHKSLKSPVIQQKDNPDPVVLSPDLQRGAKHAQLSKLAEIRKDLQEINFTTSSPDFSVALGYLP